ncbi:MAG: hypothetical protein RL417_2585 [Pseudomonadota bacterium]|jgi:uncharacterized membrane protein
MSFTHPSYLLALCGVIGLAIYQLRVARLQGKPRGQPAISVLLYWSAAALLVVTAAGPYIEAEIKTSNATLLLDISESMDETAATQLLDTVDRYKTAGTELEIVPFSRETAPISAFSHEGFRALRNAWFKLDVGGTNIERALQNILGREPSSILIASDGFETEGDVVSLAPALKARGFRLYPLVPKNESRAGRFTISNLHVPLRAPTQQSVDIRVSLRNETDRRQHGRLRVTHDGKNVFEQRVSVEPGKELLAIAPSDPSKEGIKEIVATLTPEDSDIPPSSATAYLAGQTREKILLLNGSVEDGRFLTELLKDQSYQLTSIDIGDQKRDFPPLGQFSTVIVNNVARTQLRDGFPAEAERFVRAGGGFLMLGGNRSFGLGGYLNTPLEQILPVEMLPPQTVKKRLNVAVALVLDKSRSMAFGDRIEYAKEAARETVRNLKNDDYLTVIGFDSAPFVVVKLGQLSEIRADALERVERLFPANKTNMLPAIEEARRALTRANAGRKHMIILTDGRIPDEGPYYAELVRQMRLLGITVSTVLVGGETDTGMLNQMAQLGGGAYYQVADPSSLPRIFISDIKVSTGERSLKESEEFLVRAAPGLTSTSLTSFPPLRGYVQTKPRERADLELVTMIDDKAEPLLASWAVGSGKAAAFTSDVSGRWSNYWVGWSKFQTFWSDVLRAVRPANDKSEDIDFDLRTFYAHGFLNIDLSIFNEGVTGAANAVLTLPDGGTRDVELSPTSRGRFKGQLGGVIPGKYELRARVGERRLNPVAFYLSGELFGERKGQGFNMPLLAALASATGGEINPAPTAVTAQVYTQKKKRELGPLGLLLAAMLLLSAILWREVFERSPGAIRNLVRLGRGGGRKAA